MRPAKIQISRDICPVLSESSLYVHWVAMAQDFFMRTATTLIDLCSDEAGAHADLSLLGVCHFCWFYRAAAQISRSFWYGEEEKREQMSLVTRKPVFGVSAQVRLDPAFSATEAS